MPTPEVYEPYTLRHTPTSQQVRGWVGDTTPSPQIRHTSQDVERPRRPTDEIFRDFSGDNDEIVPPHGAAVCRKRTPLKDLEVETAVHGCNVANASLRRARRSSTAGDLENGTVSLLENFIPLCGLWWRVDEQMDIIKCCLVLMLRLLCSTI
jgi:hypothetical protein